jgi:hypothetical protein
MALPDSVSTLVSVLVALLELVSPASVLVTLLILHYTDVTGVAPLAAQLSVM